MIAQRQPRSMFWLDAFAKTARERGKGGLPHDTRLPLASRSCS